MIIDKPLYELELYRPPLTATEDFALFWEQALRDSAVQPLQATLEEYTYPVERISVYKVHYDGFGPSTRIAGWYLLPDESYRLNVQGKTPTIVQYHGYGASKGVPAQYLAWALQGYCVFAVDVRGQNGETPDNAVYPAGGANGHMSKGILDPQSYYYRYVYMDCMRAVDFVRSRPETGPIFLTGGSQGGGLTLATAALAGDYIAGAMPDVPYLAHFRRALEVFSEGPYHELVDYWKAHPFDIETSYHTLSYFDAMNFASRISCPVLFSVAMLDQICPPSTGFAVYNHLLSKKQMKLYPYNGHEGGGMFQEEEKYRFTRDIANSLR